MADIQDQSCEVSDGSFGVCDGVNYQWWEQEVTVGTSGPRSRVDLYLGKTGTGGTTYYLKLKSDSGGSPNALISDTISINPSTISNGWNSFYFSTQPDLSAGTHYHIVFGRTTSDMSNYLSIYYKGGGSGYTAGDAQRGTSEYSWTGTTVDIRFIEYYSTGADNTSAMFQLF